MHITKAKSEKQLMVFSMTTLVQFYNEHADKPVNKFTDKKTAAKRCWPFIGKATKPVESVEPAKTKPSKPNKVSKKKVTKKRGRKLGVVSRINELILKDVPPQEIIDDYIIKEFPSSKANVKAVYWCRSKLKSEGLLK